MTGLEPLLISAGMGAATASTVATVASVGAGVASVGSTIAGMGAARGQAKGEIAQSNYNEATARRDTALAIQRERRDQTIRAGRQFAQGAAQGAGTSGNLLDIMADTAYQSELSVLGMRDSLMVTQAGESSKRSNINSSYKKQVYGSLLSGAANLGSIYK